MQYICIRYQSSWSRWSRFFFFFIEGCKWPWWKNDKERMQCRHQGQPKLHEGPRFLCKITAHSHASLHTVCALAYYTHTHHTMRHQSTCPLSRFFLSCPYDGKMSETVSEKGSHVIITKGSQVNDKSRPAVPLLGLFMQLMSGSRWRAMGSCWGHHR